MLPERINNSKRLAKVRRNKKPRPAREKRNCEEVKEMDGSELGRSGVRCGPDHYSADRHLPRQPPLRLMFNSTSLSVHFSWEAFVVHSMTLSGILPASPHFPHATPDRPITLQVI